MTKPDFRFVLILLLAAGLSALYLQKDFWFDERWTLTDFVSLGFWGLFTDYHQPNNHMVFTALLVLWKKGCDAAGLPEKFLRLLPWVFSIGSVAILYAVVEARRGRGAAVWACLLYATSHFFLWHACQLRGYALSCLEVSAGLLLAHHIILRPSAGRLALFCLLAAVAVGTVPTNLVTFSCIGLWAAVELRRQGLEKTGRWAAKSAALVAAPLPGLVFYLWHPVVREQFFSHSVNASTWKDVASLYGELAEKYLADFVWVLPLLAAGIAMALMRDAASDEVSGKPRRFLVFFVASLLPLAGGLFLAYYSRNFVPLIPWWSAGLGMAMDEVCVWLKSRGRRWRWIPVLLLSALVAAAAWREVTLASRLGDRWTDTKN